MVRLLAEFDLELEWLGFELHPETPRGGVPLTRLFPAARIEGMHQHLKQAAAGFGVTMNTPDHLPNTRRALAIAEQARDVGRLHQARHAAMEAHWKQGLNIEDDAVLGMIAQAAGLDPAVAVPAADLPQWQVRVDAMRSEAQQWGVSGIPTFFLLPDGWSLDGADSWTGPKPLRVVGCQPIEVLRQAARQAGALAR